MLKLLHSFLFGSRICSGCRQHQVVSSALCRDCYVRMSAFLSAQMSRPRHGSHHVPLSFQESKQMSMSDMQ